MFEVNEKLTKERIELLDESDDIFYRWQNPEWEIEGEYTQSWGMLFSSAEEAREDSENWGISKDYAILPGKSCTKTFSSIMDWSDQFDNSFVLLVFKGRDTYVYGHAGEYVAEYISPVAIFSFEDALEFYNNNYDYKEAEEERGGFEQKEQLDLPKETPHRVPKTGRSR